MIEILASSRCVLAQVGGQWGQGPAEQPSNWRVPKGIIPDSTIERLQQRYPWINNANDLEDLLRDIGRRHATTRLEAYFSDGMWLIKGANAPLLANIEIEMVSRVLRAPLYAAVQGYTGQVDSDELRSKLEDTIKSFLRRRGYPLAQLSLNEAMTSSGIELTYIVREGDPCIINRVEFGFNIPKKIKFGVKRGDLCDRDMIEDKINQLAEELRALGYNQLKINIQDFVWNADTNAADLYIGGVLGQRIRYEIIDKSQSLFASEIFSEDELRQIDPTIFGPDAMAVELERRYRSKGYLDVEISGPQVKKSQDDAFIYVYEINPGQKYRLRSIKFEGTSVFSEEELLDIFQHQQTFMLDVERAPPYDPEEINNGINRIRAKYQQAGYWDVNIRDPGGGQRDRETGTVRLTLQIDEKQRHILTGVNFVGNRALPAGELRNLLPTEENQALDRSQLLDFQQAVRTTYLNQGYLYAEVDLSLSTKQQRKDIETAIVVMIKEGPRVRIGDITITGLIKTLPKVVRRELTFETGDWYEPEKISQSRQALTRLGIFRSVQILPADRNAVENLAPELDLVIDIRETKPGNVAFGPGWSLSKGWSYGAEASYSNIGGAGRQISIRSAISEEKHQHAIGSKTLLGRRIGTGFTEPWIFDLPIDLQIKASQQAEWGGELWELSFGGEIALQHKLRVIVPDATITTFYGQEIARTEGPTERENDLIADDVRIGSTGLRFNLDRRNNLKFPTSGYSLDTEAAWARYMFGGDLQYFRWSISPSFYFGLADDLALALGINLTSYEDIDRKTGYGVLPPTERRKVSVGDQVRGYRSGSLGPIVISPEYSEVSDATSASGRRCSIGSTRSQLDGNRRTIIKTELRKKLTEDISMTAFIDNGNVFLSRSQADRFAKAYVAPVKPSNKLTECSDTQAVTRRVEDNNGYEYNGLITKPPYLWDYHYWSYGTALSLLTPVGAINVAYGLPWHEPKTEVCSKDPNRCYPRAKQEGYWLWRGELQINLGARF